MHLLALFSTRFYNICNKFPLCRLFIFTCIRCNLHRISGNEEGGFGWIAFNYLKKIIGPKKVTLTLLVPFILTIFPFFPSLFQISLCLFLDLYFLFINIFLSFYNTIYIFVYPFVLSFPLYHWLFSSMLMFLQDPWSDSLCCSRDGRGFISSISDGSHPGWCWFYPSGI